MCSIGGFVSSKPLSQDDVTRLVRALVWHGRGRGNQSAGAFVGGRIVKHAVEAGKFIGMEDFQAACAPASFALTHTRQPTCGGTGDAQAQPFQVGDAVTVHNGFYFNVRELRKAHGLKKPSGVDSELVASFLSRSPIDKLPEFLASTDGVSAIAAYRSGKLYLACHGNPIAKVSFRTHDGVSVTVFGSTIAQVDAAVAHVWLAPHSAEMLPDDSVFSLTPTGAKRLAKVKTNWASLGHSFAGMDDYGPFGDNRCDGCHRDAAKGGLQNVHGAYLCKACRREVRGMSRYLKGA